MHRRFIKAITVFSLFFAADATSGKWELYFRPSHITAIAQKRGVYWVGTETEGIVPYEKVTNGMKWRPAANIGSQREIKSIVCENDSIFRLIHESTLYTYDENSSVEDTAIPDAYELCKDNNGQVYCIGYDQQNSLFYRQDTGWTAFKCDNNRSQVKQVAFDSQNNLYALTFYNRTYLQKARAGIYPDNDTLSTDTLITVADTLRLSTLAFDGSDRLWFGDTLGQIWFLDNDSIRLDSSKTEKLRNRPVLRIKFDLLDRLWAVGREELLCWADTGWLQFDSSNTSFIKGYHWRNRYLSGSKIWYNVRPCMVLNDEGFVTFGFDDKIAWFDSTGWEFSTPDSFGMLPVENIKHTILDADDTCWLAGNKMNQIYKLHDGTFTPYANDSAMKNRSLYSFFVDKQKNLYAGGYSEFFKYNGKKWKMLHDSIYRFYSEHFYEDENGSVRIVLKEYEPTYNIYNIINDTLTYATSFDVFGLSSGSIRSLARDENGRVLMGTDLGAVIEVKDDKCKMYSRLKHKFPYAQITNILPKDDGGFWIGAGDFLVDFDGSQSRHLPANRVFGMAWRNDGSMWIAKSNDLFVFDGMEGWESITGNEGIPYKPSILKTLKTDGNGNVWLHYHDAVVKYTPSGYESMRKTVGVDHNTRPLSGKLIWAKQSLRLNLKSEADLVIDYFSLNGRKVHQISRSLQTGAHEITLFPEGKFGGANNVYIVRAQITKGSYKDSFTKKFIFMP